MAQREPECAALKCAQIDFDGGVDHRGKGGESAEGDEPIGEEAQGHEEAGEEPGEAVGDASDAARVGRLEGGEVAAE